MTRLLVAAAAILVGSAASANTAVTVMNGNGQAIPTKPTGGTPKVYQMLMDMPSNAIIKWFPNVAAGKRFVLQSVSGSCMASQASTGLIAMLMKYDGASNFPIDLATVRQPYGTSTRHTWSQPMNISYKQGDAFGMRLYKSDSHSMSSCYVVVTGDLYDDY